MFRVDARGRLAEKVAGYLQAQLPEGHLVLARYAPRDGGDRIAVVVIGGAGVFVVEPRDEEGDFVCYQDHWYQGDGIVAHPLSDAPSLRARDNAARVKRDLGTGGFITVKVDALVLLTRGRPLNVRSSCVPVIAGLDALVRHVAQRAVTPPSPEHARALADALDHPIKLALS